MSVVSATYDAERGGSWSEACPEKNMRPHLKNRLTAEGLGGMAQVTECLPNKLNAQIQSSVLINKINKM
jgi:hypothetical protein